MDIENSFHATTKILQLFQQDRCMPCPAGTSDGGATMGLKTNLTAKQISFIFKELWKS